MIHSFARDKDGRNEDQSANTVFAPTVRAHNETLKFMNLYYRIWSDAIVFERTKHGHMRNWKVFTLIPISVIQGLNLLVIFILIGFLTGNFANLFLEIDLFPGSMLDSFISGSITMFLPFLLLNYILVFWNERYKNIIEKYPHKNGKLYLLYFLISIGLFLGPLIIGKIIGKI